MALGTLGAVAQEQQIGYDDLRAIATGTAGLKIVRRASQDERLLPETKEDMLELTSFDELAQALKEKTARPERASVVFDQAALLVDTRAKGGS